jgi:hypothetical protein
VWAKHTGLVSYSRMVLSPRYFIKYYISINIRRLFPSKEGV